MKRPDINTATKDELVSYIEWAAPILEAAGELKVAISNIIHIVADELNQISDGNKSRLNVLTSDDKLFERVNLIIKNKAEWVASGSIVESDKATEPKKKITKMQDIVLNK